MLGASSRGHTHCFRWLCAEFNVAGLHGAPPLRLGSSALDPQGDPPESHFRVQACDAAVAYERKGSNASQLLPKPTAPSGRRWHWMRGTRSAGSTKQSRTNHQGTGLGGPARQTAGSRGPPWPKQQGSPRNHLSALHPRLRRRAALAKGLSARDSAPRTEAQGGRALEPGGLPFPLPSPFSHLRLSSLWATDNQWEAEQSPHLLLRSAKMQGRGCF